MNKSLDKIMILVLVVIASSFMFACSHSHSSTEKTSRLIASHQEQPERNFAIKYTQNKKINLFKDKESTNHDTWMQLLFKTVDKTKCDLFYYSDKKNLQQFTMMPFEIEKTALLLVYPGNYSHDGIDKIFTSKFIIELEKDLEIECEIRDKDIFIDPSKIIDTLNALTGFHFSK